MKRAAGESLWLLGVLFAPLAASLEAARLLGLGAAPFEGAPRTLFYIRAYLSPLDALGYGRLRAIIWGAAGLAVLYRFLPARVRLAALALFGALFFCWLLPGTLALAAGCAAILVWLGRAAPARALRTAAGAAGLGALWYCWFRHGRELSAGQWRVAGFLTLRAWSFWMDGCDPQLNVRFLDFLVYMLGGFPCSLSNIWYGFADFTGSYRPELDRATARRGVALIYRGLAKWAAALAAEMVLGPLTLPGSALAVSAPVLWLQASAGLALFLLRIVGFYQLAQGGLRLFGFAVSDQADEPWLSTSPLDFWRRVSAHNRAFVLKYASIPLFRRWRWEPAALLAAFAAALGANLLLNKPTFFPGGPVSGRWIAVWSLEYALFALVCLGELLWRRSAWARGRSGPKAARGWRRAGLVAATLGVMILLSAPGPGVLHVAHGDAPFFERWSGVYKRMLLLKGLAAR